jgi:hypothetical protein
MAALERNAPDEIDEPTYRPETVGARRPFQLRLRDV